MVLIVQAFPVVAELRQAVRVDIRQPVSVESASLTVWCAESLQTYTLLAHLVTFLPSFMQSNSPRPYASVLHCI